MEHRYVVRAARRRKITYDARWKKLSVIERAIAMAALLLPKRSLNGAQTSEGRVCGTILNWFAAQSCPCGCAAANDAEGYDGVD